MHKITPDFKRGGYNYVRDFENLNILIDKGVEMRVATIAMGLGLGAFLMTGCGGDVNPLPEATGTLDENQSIGLVRGISDTALLPSELVRNMSLGASKFGKTFSTSGEDNDPYPEGEHDCNNGGTETIKTISGKSPYRSSDIEASKWVVEKKYDKCDLGNGVKNSGTIITPPKNNLNFKPHIVLRGA